MAEKKEGGLLSKEKREILFFRRGKPLRGKRRRAGLRRGKGSKTKKRMSSHEGPLLCALPEKRGRSAEFARR